MKDDQAVCKNCGRPIPADFLKKHPNARFCPKSIFPDSNCKDRYWSRGQRQISKLEGRILVLEDAVIKLTAAQSLFVETEKVVADGIREISNG